MTKLVNEYHINFLGKTFLVRVDKRLIETELTSILKKRGLLNKKPEVIISTSLFGMGGAWIAPYDFKVFTVGPTVVIWLRSITIQLLFVIRKILHGDRRLYHQILEERLNNILGHEFGHAYHTTANPSLLVWALKYLGFIVSGGAIGGILGWLIQMDS